MGTKHIPEEAEALRRERDRQRPRVILTDAARAGPELATAWCEYVAAHVLLSSDDELGLRPEDELPRLREQAEDTSQPLVVRQQALLILAHHRTERACQELARFLKAPDPALALFGAMALEEAIQWARPPPPPPPPRLRQRCQHSRRRPRARGDA